jgi:hypothetical protein
MSKRELIEKNKQKIKDKFLRAQLNTEKKRDELGIETLKVDNNTDKILLKTIRNIQDNRER